MANLDVKCKLTGGGGALEHTSEEDVVVLVLPKVGSRVLSELVVSL